MSGWPTRWPIVGSRFSDQPPGHFRALGAGAAPLSFAHALTRSRPANFVGQRFFSAPPTFVQSRLRCPGRVSVTRSSDGSTLACFPILFTCLLSSIAAPVLLEHAKMSLSADEKSSFTGEAGVDAAVDAPAVYEIDPAVERRVVRKLDCTVLIAFGLVFGACRSPSSFSVSVTLFLPVPVMLTRQRTLQV